MSRVWSCNEWDPLEEVIVGKPLRARFPTSDPSTPLAEFPDRPLGDIPQGPFPQQIVEETEEDLNAFVTVLEDLGITVKLLERHGLEVIPLKLRHSKMLGGGFHCVTLDVRRAGSLERYFD